MEFIKKGERINAVDDLGVVVAYIEKDYMGTRGNIRGWAHYVYNPKLNKYEYGGGRHSIYDAFPVIFKSIKAFKEYYS